VAVDAAQGAALPLGRSLDEAAMSRLHVRFWLLAGLGILLDGFDFFIIGVANPLIAQDFGISDAEKGLVSAAAIVGAIFGAGLLGPLGDKIGRRRIFQFDLALFVVFSVLSAAAPNLWWLIAFRLVLGVAIGLDYPIAAGYLAEVLPARGRGRWLTAAFSLQAGGIMLGALIGVVVLELAPDVDSWRIMLGVGAVPALVIMLFRRGTPESPRWLAQNGRADEARPRGGRGAHGPSGGGHRTLAAEVFPSEVRAGGRALPQRARSWAPPSASSCSRSSWTTSGLARCWRSSRARAWWRLP